MIFEFKFRRALALVFCFQLLGFSVGAENIWSEKGKNAKNLVQLPSVAPVVKELDATVVNISTTMANAPSRELPFNDPEGLFERFFGTPSPSPRRSMGSGFLISKDGYILTNNHVIEGAESIKVTLNSSQYDTPAKTQEFEAKVVGADPRTDIALIKIEPKKSLPYAFLGRSGDLGKGDWVIAIGNPFGLEHSVSVGIISAKNREINANENRRFDDFIQTDAAINFGNSGGPLVNLKGEVIGINTAITAQGSGIGFAIPIDLVKRLIPDLVKGGKVQRGYLGVMIQDVTPEMKDALGLKEAKGVFVSDIAPGGPADGSPLQAGDVIIAVDGKTTEVSSDLQDVIASKKPGESVRLNIIRDKRQLKLSITLGSLDGQQDESSLPENAKTDRLGLLVRSIEDKGVIVQGLRPGSAAAKAGILPGDEIKEITYQSKKVPITSLRAYRELLKTVKAGESILFKISRSQGRRKAQLFIAFRVPSKKPEPKKDK